MSKEIKIGILAIVGLGSLIWGYNFLKGQNLFKSQSIYHVKYDNIYQLEVSAPVYINGYQVGNVNNIDIDPENMQNIIVSLEILPKVKLPQNTVAQLYSDGVMGDMAIKLSYTGTCNDDCIESEEYIEGATLSFLGSFLQPDELDEYIAKLKSGVGSMMDTLNHIMDDPEFQNSEIGQLTTSVKNTVHNLESTSIRMNQMMAANSKALNEVTENLAKITGGIAEKQESLNQTIQNIGTLTGTLADGGLEKTLNNTNTALEKLGKAGDQTQETLKSLETTSDRLSSVLQALNQGEGTLGKLIKKDEIYGELNSTLQNLDLLLQDFRLNPKRYVNVSVFGKKSKDYTLPENDPAMELRDTTSQ
ncbi:MCE family protein [Membranicola marinus]|uniref:MCE family protein n=1 Tax=Membranihabitans marinus TaxID=1227546 RepID=A0A953HVC0_9BACT|nr:MlaD family protein [Membranihabitans marinus]MBY5958866.1 MCE family protein [Membranihabitans marinus]